MSRTKTVVAGLAAAFLLAGCAGSVGGAGVAARVGRGEITTAALSDVLDRVQESERPRANAEGSRAELSRAQLTRLIRVRIFDEAARRLGATVTAAEVDRRLAQAAQRAGGQEQLEAAARANGVPPSELRDYERYSAVIEAVSAKLAAAQQVTDAEVRDFYRRNVVQFERANTAHIRVATQAQASQLAARARAGEDFGALARRYSDDEQSKAAGGEVGERGRGQSAPEYDNAVFVAKAGDIVGPVRTAAGWHVIKVVSRNTRTLEQAREEIEEGLLAEKGNQAVVTYIVSLAAELRVRVNPRFGRWNPTEVEVVAPADDLSSPAPSRLRQGGPVDPFAPQPSASPTP